MTESTLSLAYTGLQKEVGFLLGRGRDTSAWSADETTEVSDIIQAGLRQFYAAHDWTFLKLSKTLTLSAKYETGTVTIVDGVVTLASGTWPSWAADGDLELSTGIYSVYSRTSDTVITVDDLSLDASAGTTYVLTRSVNTLDDDFGGLIGNITYQSNDGLRRTIVQVPEHVIRQKRQGAVLASSWPELVAIRPKSSDMTTGQRFEAAWWPNSDSAYVLHYQYLALTESLTGTRLYAYGGMMHSEVIKSSCLAKAELYRDDALGHYTEQFEKELSRAIESDKMRQPTYLGKNRDRSDDDYTGRDRAIRVSYNGVFY